MERPIPSVQQTVDSISLAQLTAGIAGIIAAAALVYQFEGTAAIVSATGLSGAGACALAPLVAPAPRRIMDSRGLAIALVSGPLRYLAFGFVAASTSLILFLAVLLGNVDPAISVNRLGALAFGIVVGFVTGRSLFVSNLAFLGLSGSNDRAPFIAGGTVSERPAVRTNYCGYIIAEFQRTAPTREPSGAVLGSVRVGLLPSHDEDFQPTEKNVGEVLRSSQKEQDAVPPRYATAPVGIDYGVNSRRVPFTISVANPGFTILPSSIDLIATHTSFAGPVEFKILRSPVGSDSRVSPFMERVLMVELAQNGSTIQILELDASGQPQDS